MASWVDKLQSMYLAVGLLLALVHLHTTWLEGEADDPHVQSLVPGGVANFQPPRRTLLQTKQKVRAVNLGGWLVIEGWIKPELFYKENLPADNDLLDGTRIQLKSMSNGPAKGLYMVAEGGGGSVVACNRTTPQSWETFKIWRVSPGIYSLRVENNEFIGAINNGGGNVIATATISREWETFTITRNPNDQSKVHIQAGNGNYFQARNKNQVTADYQANWGPNDGWGTNDAVAIFNMTVLGGLQGEFQLSNAWGAGAAAAQTALKNHRDTFIQEQDFIWLSTHGINAVRIPVGWWIAYDPNPPAPFVGGSLQALDNAFSWGNKHGIKIIVDLHAPPGSQNGQEHSGTRDGVWQWAQNSTYITQSIQVIDFLANRYAGSQALYPQTLLGIELLNEPFNTLAFPAVPDVKVLQDYYKTGYNTVRKYSATANVIMCQVIGSSEDAIASLANLIPSDKNVVIDWHPYNLFDSNTYGSLSVQGNIDFVNNQRLNFVNNQRLNFVTRINNLNAASLLVGEWTNEWYVQGASQSDYLRFANAQENVFGQAAFGWSQWSYRNAEDRWSYETSVNQGYMPQLPVS